jgi:hypothetical protein
MSSVVARTGRLEVEEPMNEYLTFRRMSTPVFHDNVAAIRARSGPSPPAAADV